MFKRSAACVALGLLACAGQANASVMATSTTIVPVDHYVAPASTQGSVMLDVTGSARNRKSPFANSTSAYIAVASGYATYVSSKLSNELSLVWGTPDKYNTVRLFDGASLVDTFSGSLVGGGAGSTNYFTTLRTTESFNRVELVSTGASFEFSNVSLSAVPLPAAAPMFGAALVAFGLAGFALSRRTATAA